MKKIISTLAISALLASNAQAFSFDSRSFGMGGIGVTTSKYYTAPFHNPALGAKFDESDDFGLLFPSLGVSFQDKDDLVNKAQDIADLVDNLQAFQDVSYYEGAITTLQTSIKSIDFSNLSSDLFNTETIATLDKFKNMTGAIDLTEILNEVGTLVNLNSSQLSELGLSGSELYKIEDTLNTLADAQNVLNTLNSVKSSRANLNIGTGITASMAFNAITITPFVKGQLDTIVLTNIHEDDLNIDNLLNYSYGTYDLKSMASATGVLIVDYGVSFAKKWSFEHDNDILNNSTLYVGLSPKVQSVHTINYAVDINNFEFDDFEADEYMNDKNGFNLDIGTAYSLENGITTGLVVKNLFAKEYKTKTVLGTSATYEVHPVVTAGVSYNYSIFTVGVDVDLNKTKRFTSFSSTDNNVNASIDDIQMLGLGAEIDLWKWVQLRFGYQTDLQDNLENEFTVGLGLSPFDVFHLDVAGTYASETQFGVAVQLAYTF